LGCRLRGDAASELIVDIGALKRRRDRLRLRASSSATARNDVHEHDQRDDGYRSDGDYGNGGRRDEHGELLSRPMCPKLRPTLQLVQDALVRASWYRIRAVSSGF
jgi:hypothetical protein